MTHNILCVIGTRPEAVKMAPVVAVLQASSWARVRVLATAQHRQMLDQVLNAFAIRPDVDLNLMQRDQPLAWLTARLLEQGDAVLATEQPDAILVQGDTTSAMALALAAFYRQVPVGHVEAGLRTGDVTQPFPEELNRQYITRATTWHFAPTLLASRRLLAEGCAPGRVFVTGNTVVDALRRMARTTTPLGVDLPAGRRLILVTAHRRENLGPPLVRICTAIRELAGAHGDVHFLYPVHPNPRVADTVRAMLGDVPRVTLCAPLSYLAFVVAMKQAFLILTDSGGIQEEAPVLGRPVLVLRNTTERPEAVDAGAAKLVGTDVAAIINAVEHLLGDPAAYCAMTSAVSPFGDGRAAERIVHILREQLGAA